MTKPCRKCEQLFVVVRNQYVHYCPDCKPKQKYTRVCTYCRAVFVTTHSTTYSCQDCKNDMHKSIFKNLDEPKKREPKPILITNEEQRKIDENVRNMHRLQYEFIHLKPGMEEFEDLAKKITPIQNIRKTSLADLPYRPYVPEENAKSLFGLRRENVRELR